MAKQDPPPAAPAADPAALKKRYDDLAAEVARQARVVEQERRSPKAQTPAEKKLADLRDQKRSAFAAWQQAGGGG